jgi:hypothetical protein
MSIEQLTQLVPPPTNPIETGSASDWNNVESQLALTLPTDFRELILTYGTGAFNDWLIVFNPSARNRYYNLVAMASEILDAYLSMKQDFPDKFPHPAYPTPHGLFPWARADNGDTFYWIIDYENHQWSTILCESRFGEMETYREQPTELLASLLSGVIQSNIFPDFDGDPPKFTQK